jgi:hypothetical protein
MIPFDYYDGLAKIVTEYRHWRWLPGMSYVNLETNTRGVVTDEFYYEGNNYNKKYIPDLLDPATLGCIHFLASQAWGGTYINIEKDPNNGNRFIEWSVFDDKGLKIEGAAGLFVLEEKEGILVNALLETLKLAHEKALPEVF